MLSSWQNKAERVVSNFDNYINQVAERIWKVGGSTIIMINGRQLTEYIYDYGLGIANRESH